MKLSAHDGYDGAMGTSIQRFNLTPDDFGGKSLEGCNDNLVLTRPDVIQAIDESFLAVGVDVVVTFSDGYPLLAPTEGNRRVLAVYDGVSRDLGFGSVVAPRLS